MTLQFALLIILSLATMGLAAAKWHAFVCADLERLREQEYWVGRFTRGARLLAEDDRVPESLVSTLVSLNQFLLDREACIQIFRIFTRPRGGNRPFVSTPEELALPEDHPDLARTISDTFFAAMMAMTYTDLRWGNRARGAIARRYSGEAQATELARAAREVAKNDHDLPPGLIAA